LIGMLVASMVLLGLWLRRSAKKRFLEQSANSGNLTQCLNQTLISDSFVGDEN